MNNHPRGDSSSYYQGRHKVSECLANGQLRLFDAMLEFSGRLSY